MSTRIRRTNLRRMIHDAGLSVPSGHFDYDGFAGKLDYAKQLGVNWMVCPMLPKSQWTLARRISHSGKAVQRVGQARERHRHAIRLPQSRLRIPRVNGPSGKQTGYDVLLAETDPALVFFEMDCYWVAQSGNDPVKMLHRLGDRARMIHLKDRKPGFAPSNDMEESSSHFTEVGHGSLNWKAILDTAQSMRIEHYFVEQDEIPGNPIASIHSSYQYLRTIMS